MRKFAIAAVAVLAIAGSTAVYAQHRHWWPRPFADEPGGPGGLADARIAAVHAGLKLTADQEKLWPPVEAAVQGIRQAADRSRQCADERAAGRFQPAEAGRSGGAAARPRRQHGGHGGGHEEDRRCRRPALQDARRRPEAPARRPDPYGRRFGGREGWRPSPVRARNGHGPRLRPATTATTGTAMTGTADRTGAAPSGSDARPIAGSIRTSAEAAEIQRLFAVSGDPPKPGKTRSGLLDIAGSLC